MNFTTYDMERPAMPVTAPVGAVVPGSLLAVAASVGNYGVGVPTAPGKPWIARNERQMGRRFGQITGRPTRRLGSEST